MIKRFLNVPCNIKADSIKEDGSFEGYASTFGGTPDSYGDIITKGAFKESIKRGGRNKTGVAMLWQHQSDNPIGKWPSLIEDDSGLATKGKLTLGVQKADEAYLLLKDESIQHYSIGYDLERDEKGRVLEGSYTFDKETGVRYLKAVELWEISLVTFPANINATVVTVKDLENYLKEINDPRELEDRLREAGLSKEAAKYVVSLARPTLREADKKDESNIDGLAKILASLKQANFSLELARKINN